MKLTVDNKSFVEAVTWVTKNYDAKNTNAYVALVVSEKGEAHLFHASRTSFMKSAFSVLDADVDRSELTKGKMTLALDGRYLSSLASAVGGSTEPLEFSRPTDGTEKLNVKMKNGSFTIPLVNVRVASEPEVVTLGEVDSHEFFDALQRLSKLCDPINAGVLPALGSVDLSLSPADKSITLMATDRYALGEVTVSFDPTNAAKAYVEDAGHLLLPVENATLFSPARGLGMSTTLVHETKGGKFGYVLADGRVALFSLTDAEPLGYQVLKKKAAESKANSFKVDVAALKKAIASISTLVWDETTVFLDITEDGLVVADSTRSNKVSVPVEDVRIDKDYSVSFVRSFINESFSPIATASMTMNWSSEKSAFVLDPIMDDGTSVDNVFVFVSTSA